MTRTRLQELMLFLDTLEHYTTEGYPIISGLDLSAQTVKKKSTKKAIKKIYELVCQGSTMTEAMAQQPRKIFPTELILLLAVGEQTGSFDQAIHSAKEHFQEKLIAKDTCFTISLATITFLATLLPYCYVTGRNLAKKKK